MAGIISRLAPLTGVYPRIGRARGEIIKVIYFLVCHFSESVEQRDDICGIILANRASVLCLVLATLLGVLSAVVFLRYSYAIRRGASFVSDGNYIPIARVSSETRVF